MKNLSLISLSFSLVLAASNAVAQEVRPAAPATPAPPVPAAGPALQTLPPPPPAQAQPAVTPPLPPQSSPPPPVPRSPTVAATQPPDDAASPPPEAPPEPSDYDARVEMWRLEMGYRGSYVTSPGFDPFSTNDFLPAVSITASRTIASSGVVSFAPGISWDYGKSTALSRGDNAALSMHRLTVPLEGRIHIVPWGYALLRVSPGVVAQHAEVDDSSSPATLTKNRWLFATDVSAGYAWLVWPQKSARHLARVWLQADGGYGWVAGERLNLTPALAAGDTRMVSGIDLGSIQMSGGFFRFAAAVSY